MSWIIHYAVTVLLNKIKTAGHITVKTREAVAQYILLVKQIIRMIE